MLDTVLKILIESNHPDAADAIREVAVCKAAVKYYQVVLKRMDRDDRAIREAAQMAHKIGQEALAVRLRNSLKDVTVPYEMLMEAL